MYSDSDWLRILSGAGVRDFTAAKWAHPFADEVQLDKFSKGEADLIDFLPQILHETNLLEQLQENLLYNPERICQVWPNRFPTLASALPCAMNAQRLANTVYADRMGNGNFASGDGYTFAGKGPPMLTGRAAYKHVGLLCGQDLEVSPQLMLQPHFGLSIAIRWWEGDIPDSMLGDQVSLRRKVNGSTLGIERVATIRSKLVEVLA